MPRGNPDFFGQSTIDKGGKIITYTNTKILSPVGTSFTLFESTNKMRLLRLSYYIGMPSFDANIGMSIIIDDNPVIPIHLYLKYPYYNLAQTPFFHTITIADIVNLILSAECNRDILIDHYIKITASTYVAAPATFIFHAIYEDFSE